MAQMPWGGYQILVAASSHQNMAQCKRKQIGEGEKEEIHISRISEHCLQSIKVITTKIYKNYLI
jgi:hypothetical protein